MESHHLTAGAAFDVLVAASHRQHVKLREVAQHVLDAGEDPHVAATAR
jgi:AmiR/NasT family two-component response regulator